MKELSEEEKEFNRILLNTIPQWSTWAPVWMVWLAVTIPLFSHLNVTLHDGRVVPMPWHGSIMLGIGTLTIPSVWLGWCGDLWLRRIYYRFKMWRNS